MAKQEYETCPDCNGSGNDGPDDSCDLCDGTGSVPDTSYLGIPMNED
jgi:DnaJ-class molecular chaperone